MSHATLAAVAILTLLAGSCANPDAAIRDRLARRIQVLVNSGFAGQVVVAHNGRVLLSEAYGYADRSHVVRVTRETGFDVASATKAFTAAAILSLRDSGRLRLSSTTGEVFPDAPADKRTITIEQLLSHTSGLRQTYAADGETDRASAVREVLSQPLASAPGKDFSYSDDGYVLLAAVIETASGTSYEQYLRTHLLIPAGMTHTVFWGDVSFADPSKVAALQQPLEARLLGPHWGQRGSGGLISTADDLFNWWMALSHGRVVAQRSVDELTQERRKLSSGIGVGYGWFWSTTDAGTRSLWSRGNEDFGPNAIVAVYPEQQMVIVATSDHFIDHEPWSRRMKNDLEALLVGAK